MENEIREEPKENGATSEKEKGMRDQGVEGAHDLVNRGDFREHNFARSLVVGCC